MIKSFISYFLVGILFVPSILQAFHLHNDHKKEKFCFENDLHYHSDDQSCLFEYTFNNQLSDLKKYYSSENSPEFLAKRIPNKTNYYSINYFCLTDERGPPYYMITSEV